MWWRRRRQLERDLERELRNHLELGAEERRESEATAQEALFAAQRALGNESLLKETVREVWGWTSVERIGRDIRYGLRLLRKTPDSARLQSFHSR